MLLYPRAWQRSGSFFKTLPSQLLVYQQVMVPLHLFFLPHILQCALDSLLQRIGFKGTRGKLLSSFFICKNRNS